MIDIDRIPKLQALVKLLGNRVKSKKKLHKLIYLLQQVGEDFGYKYVYCVVSDQSGHEELKVKP